MIEWFGRCAIKYDFESPITSAFKCFTIFNIFRPKWHKTRTDLKDNLLFLECASTKNIISNCKLKQNFLKNFPIGRVES
jgi:hypothetical protein